MGKCSSKHVPEFGLSLNMYLGEDLEDTHGRTILDDEERNRVPLLTLSNVVLVPGQILPLHIFQPHIASMIRHTMDNNKTFGVTTLRDSDDRGVSYATIGTTAEILSIREETDEASGIINVRAKAIGRQRFVIENSHRQADGNDLATIRTKAEVLLPHPLSYLVSNLSTSPDMCPDKCPDRDSYDSAGGAAASDLASVVTSFCASRNQRKPRGCSTSCMTPWPSWVYEQYDPVYLRQAICDELRTWNKCLIPENMMKEQTEFSFWVMQTLPLNDHLKIHLLGVDCPIQRLRCLLSVLKKCAALCCANCGGKICNKQDVFTMSASGPTSTFVNPGGFNYETLTLLTASGLTLRGHPSEENTWFPGYAWTIAECKNCYRHLGWRFTAVRRTLKPQKFFGLSRSALVPALKKEDVQQEPWRPML